MRTDDDDDNFELTPNGMRILKDGARVRVSLMDAQSARLHDGRGGVPGHRPGFALSDASTRDAIEEAYAEYEAVLTNAYKTDAGEPEHIAVQESAMTTDEAYALYDRELSEEWKGIGR